MQYRQPGAWWTAGLAGLSKSPKSIKLPYFFTLQHSWYEMPHKEYFFMFRLRCLNVLGNTENQKVFLPIDLEGFFCQYG